MNGFKNFHQGSLADNSFEMLQSQSRKEPQNFSLARTAKRPLCPFHVLLNLMRLWLREVKFVKRPSSVKNV
jgi:hypothetical protein